VEVSAYNRGDLSVEAYLVRLLAALCRQAGGELRVRGELVDAVGEATALLKSWDPKTQEVVLTTTLGSYGEVFRVVPEKQATAPQRIALSVPLPPDADSPAPPPPRSSASLLDESERLAALEIKLKKRRVASMLADELARRRRTEPASG
jgi:hypothetical protein